MPKYKYALSNGKFLVLNGDTQPPDSEVESRAKESGVELIPNDMVRPDGTMKGKGFFGNLNLPNGKIASEFSVADSEKMKNPDGSYQDYPSLVPSLNQNEIDAVLKSANDGKTPLPGSVYQKAEASALNRKAHGKSPFAQPGEEVNRGDNAAAAAQEQSRLEGESAAGLPRALLDSVPALGAIAGSIMGSPALGSIGAAGGRGIRDVLMEKFGLEPETSGTSKAGRAGLDAALNYFAPNLVRGLGKTVEAIGTGAERNMYLPRRIFGSTPPTIIPAAERYLGGKVADIGRSISEFGRIPVRQGEIVNPSMSKPGFTEGDILQRGLPESKVDFYHNNPPRKLIGNGFDAPSAELPSSPANSVGSTQVKTPTLNDKFKIMRTGDKIKVDKNALTPELMDKIKQMGYKVNIFDNRILAEIEKIK